MVKRPIEKEEDTGSVKGGAPTSSRPFLRLRTGRPSSPAPRCLLCQHHPHYKGALAGTLAGGAFHYVRGTSLRTNGVLFSPEAPSSTPGAQCPGRSALLAGGAPSMPEATSTASGALSSGQGHTRGRALYQGRTHTPANRTVVFKIQNGVFRVRSPPPPEGIAASCWCTCSAIMKSRGCAANTRHTWHTWNKWAPSAQEVPMSGSPFTGTAHVAGRTPGSALPGVQIPCRFYMPPAAAGGM